MTIVTSAPTLGAAPTPAELVATERAKRDPKRLAPKVEKKGRVVRKTTTGKTVELSKAAPAKKASTKAAKGPKAPRPKQVGGVTELRSGKLSARDLPCLCGCNKPTQTADARFLSGHDAKLRQGVIEENLDASCLPAIILPFFTRGETVAGLRLAKGGKKLVDMKAEGATEDE